MAVNCDEGEEIDKLHVEKNQEEVSVYMAE